MQSVVAFNRELNIYSQHPKCLVEVPLQLSNTLPLFASWIPSINPCIGRDPGYCRKGYQQALAFGKPQASQATSAPFVGTKPLCLILDDSHSHPVCLLKSECI